MNTLFAVDEPIKTRQKYAPVYKISLVKEDRYKISENIISQSSDAASIMRDYLDGADREHFVVLLLSTRNHVIGINTVSIGSLNSSIVHPREVFKPAIVGNANHIILAHNHPSGDTTPSKEDIEVTKRLVEAGNMLGIQVLDHVIVGDRYISLKEQGYM